MIDKQSIREMTYSRYTQQLMEKEPQIFADKLRATNNADEILEASRDYINEALAHPRKDNIQQFARGRVLLRVGDSDYTAKVIVAMRENGKMLLYDVLSLEKTTIQERKRTQNTVNPHKSETGRSSASTDTVSQNDTGVNPSIRGSGIENAKFSMKEVQLRAEEEMGTTALWSETGYITPDGKQLDFSGKRDGGPAGHRHMDHREIAFVFDEDGGMDGTEAMIQFMAAGNIRISPENGGINLSVLPTAAQRQKLQAFINKNKGEVIVDFDDAQGRTLHSVEYPAGTGAVRVTNDIKRYFEDGAKPLVSEVQRFRYSIKEGMGEAERYEELRDAELAVALYDADASKLTPAEVERLEMATRRDARRYVKELYEKFDVGKWYANRAAEIAFLFGGHGLDKSIHEQTTRNADYASFGKMLAVFDEIVENAIPLEIHADKYTGTRRADPNLQQVYVLVSAYEDSGIVPVQLEVKEYADVENQLYVAVTLNKIEVGLVATAYHQNDVLSAAPPTSTISLRDLFANINPVDGEFLKYVPDGFLSAEQQAAKQAALAKEQRKIEGYRLSRKDPEALTIKEQIAQYQDELNRMQPAASIQSDFRPRKNGKPDRTLMRKSLQAFYGSLRYTVDRKGFGKVQFDENALGELLREPLI